MTGSNFSTLFYSIFIFVFCPVTDGSCPQNQPCNGYSSSTPQKILQWCNAPPLCVCVSVSVHTLAGFFVSCNCV